MDDRGPESRAVDDLAHAGKRLRRYADIVENMQVGVYVYQLEKTPDGDQLRMLAANPASARLTGVPVADLVGRTIDECFPGLRERGIPQAFTEVGRTKAARRFSDFEYGDNRVLKRAWSFTAFPLPEDAVCVVFDDITERKLAEDALQDSELRFRALFENTNDAVFTLGLDGVIKTVNDRAAVVLGYRTEELLGVPFGELVAKDEQADDGRMYSELLDGATIPIYERTLVRKDSSEVPVEISAALVRDERGDPRHVQSMIRDITERKTTEGALQQAQKLESLGVMAGGIAHDFNNLLTGILGNAMLALEDLPIEHPVRAKVSEIERAALRASELTNQMLAYAGKAQVDIAPLDLNVVIQEMGRFLETVLSKKTVIENRFAEDLPAVQGDSAQIRQVVMNLITNASEALGDHGGTVTVTTRICQIDPETDPGPYFGAPIERGSYVCLEVADTGAGMDEATLSRIFDPFFTTKFTGRGLGLAAAIGIVRSHHGALIVDTQPGEGTTFKVLFPAAEEPRAPSAPRDATLDSWHGDGTVLVVDDEPGVRDVIETMLRRAGFDVITAGSGPDAIEIVRQRGPTIRVVLLDLTMREMNGDEAFRRMHELRPDLPVILLSGYAADETAQRFSTIGLAGFVHKPFAQEDLLSAIRDATARGGHSAS